MTFSVRTPGVQLARALFIVLLLCAAQGHAASDPADPFQPYLTGKPPTIIRTLEEQTTGKVRLRRVVFYSRTVQTKQGPQRSEVFALVARPSAPGRYPGLLVLHGGKGAAEQAKALAWAARGYVVVAPDLPGIADPALIPHSVGAWKGNYEQLYISAKPDVTASPIFDGVLAAVQSLYSVARATGRACGSPRCGWHLVGWVRGDDGLRPHGQRRPRGLLRVWLRLL